ncbi:hypothetical protein M2306_000384 [Myroides gitamensis]|nr:hypothetical protein [Myroides gitamensis]
MRSFISIIKKHILLILILSLLISCSNDDNTYLNEYQDNNLHKTELKLKQMIDKQLVKTPTGSETKYQTSNTTFYYGSNGYIEKTIKTHDYMPDIEYGFYEYEGNNLISRSYYMGDFLFYKEDFFYENDRLSKSTYIFPKIGIPYTTYYKYNENKDLIGTEFYKSNESMPYQTVTLHYNSAKNIITASNIYNDGYKETLTYWLDNKNNISKYSLPENYLKKFIGGTENIKSFDNSDYHYEYNKYSYPIKLENALGIQYYEYYQP